MKANSKVLINLFRDKLRKIIRNHPSDSVRLGEFMNLLTIHNIRLYSKADIAKLYRYFENPLKISKIMTPLCHLQLDYVQEYDVKKYFVVRVSDTQVNSELIDQKDLKHNISQCMITFIQVMKRLYGSQKNWFKALGGLAVAVTIQPKYFTKSLNKILSNTSHQNCADKITKLFLNESGQSTIEWKSFMKVINDYQFFPTQIQDSTFYIANTTGTSFYDVSQRTNDQKHKRSSSIKTQTIQSTKFKPSLRIKRSNKSVISQLHGTSTKSICKQKAIDFPRFFSLSSKACVLYAKEDSSKPIPKHFRPKSEQRRILEHRKTLTQPIFFQKDHTLENRAYNKQFQKIEINKNYIQPTHNLSEVHQKNGLNDGSNRRSVEQPKNLHNDRIIITK